MNGLTVRDLMDTTFVKLKPDMPLTRAISILIENGITGSTVVDDEDRLIGLLSEKDCLRTLIGGAYDRMPVGLVSDYMTKDVFSVHPDTDIFKLTEIYMQRVNRRFPVVEDGELVGQITRRDLLRALQKHWV